MDAVEWFDGNGVVHGQADTVVLIHVHLAVGFTTCFCLEQVTVGLPILSRVSSEMRLQILDAATT